MSCGKKPKKSKPKKKACPCPPKKPPTKCATELRSSVENLNDDDISDEEMPQNYMPRSRSPSRGTRSYRSRSRSTRKNDEVGSDSDRGEEEIEDYDDE